MSNSLATTARIHPLLAGAAVSVILVSLVGVAAITGILPSSHSKEESLTPNTLATASAPLTAANGLAAAPGTTMAPVANNSTTPHSQTSHHTPAHHATTQGSGTQMASAGDIACANCGTVESVQQHTQAAEKGSGVGAVAGAVLGGVLGNQVGNGNGRKLATVAGAIGGGLAGNAIEKQTNGSTRWEVRVRMSDGSLRTFTPSTNPGVQNGDQVKIVDGRITLRG